jgi:hypothetical protein
MLLLDLIWVIERWIGGAGNDNGKGITWTKERREMGGSVVLGVFPSHPQVSLQPDYVSWE